MRNKNDKNIKDILGDFVQSRPLQKGYKKVNIRKFWEERMGTMINSYTNDIYLVKKTLVVKLSSSPLRQELSYEHDKILNIFRDEFGMDYIDQVRFQ